VPERDADLAPQADDRVLIAVINRKRDLVTLERDHWYRVPVTAAPGCIDMEWIAFYLSGSLQNRGGGRGSGGVYLYARLMGFELARRRDLLPLEAAHPRQNQLYFKLQFRAVLRRDPPILNPTGRPISFIVTTWDRFAIARIMSDLTQRTGS
jgi:hypothetical protein